MSKKRITKSWLESKSACAEGMRFVINNDLIGLDEVDFIQKLVTANKNQWANWLMARRLNGTNRIRYACFAARLVLDAFERTYPNDKRPRQAIEAAELCIKQNTKINHAANAANAAANAANAAANAAYATANAAYAAAYAAYAAANAANAAANAANAAYAAAYAANAINPTFGKEIQIKIVEYGITLLEGKN